MTSNKRTESHSREPKVSPKVDVMPPSDDSPSSSSLDKALKELEAIKQSILQRSHELESKVEAFEPKAESIKGSFRKLSGTVGNLKASYNRLNQRVKDSEARFKILEQSGQSESGVDEGATAQLSGLDASLKILASAKAVTDERLQRMEDGQNGAIERLDALEAGTDRLYRRLEQGLGEHDDSLAALDNTFTALKASLTSLATDAGETKLAGLQQAESLEILGQQVNGGLADQSSALKELDQRLAELRELHTRLDQEAGKLRSEAVQQAQILQSLDSQLVDGLAQLDKERSSLEQRVNRLQEAHDGLSQDAGRLRDDSDSLSEGLRDLDTQLVEGLASQTQGLEALRSRLVDGLTGQTHDLEALDSRVARKLNGQAEELKGLDGRLGNLKAEHDGLSQRLDKEKQGLDDALQALDGRVAEGLERHDGILKDLDERHSNLKNAHDGLALEAQELRDDNLRQDETFRKGAWITGGLLLLLAIVAGTAHFTPQVVPGEAGVSAELAQELSGFEARLAEQRQVMAAAEAALGDQRQSMADSQAAFARQQQAVANNTAAIDELKQTGNGLAMAPDLSGIEQRVTDIDSKLDTELGQIKQRLFAPDEDLRGAPVDIATINSSDWLKAQSPNRYVIQLGGVYRKSELSSMMGRVEPHLDLADLSWFQTVYRGRDWFVLLYGSYARYDQALAALEALPDSVNANNPYIRSYGGVQKKLD